MDGDVEQFKFQFKISFGMSDYNSSDVILRLNGTDYVDDFFGR